MWCVQQVKAVRSSRKDQEAVHKINELCFKSISQQRKHLHRQPRPKISHQQQDNND
jgi:hypothetical protein